MLIDKMPVKDILASKDGSYLEPRNFIIYNHTNLPVSKRVAEDVQDMLRFGDPWRAWLIEDDVVVREVLRWLQFT